MMLLSSGECTRPWDRLGASAGLGAQRRSLCCWARCKDPRSRRRHPIWRPKKPMPRHLSADNRKPMMRGRPMTREVLLAVLELKRVKDDPEELDKVMKSHVSHMVKQDLSQLSSELLQQGECRICLKLLENVKREAWYIPDLRMYQHLFVSIWRKQQWDDLEKLYEEVRSVGLQDSFMAGELSLHLVSTGKVAEGLKLYYDSKAGGLVFPNSTICKMETFIREARRRAEK